MMNLIVELNKKEIHPSNDIFKIAARNIFIQFCSFFDELEILDNLAKDDLTLREVLNVIAPIRKVLKKWTGIKNTRNKMFAHYNRDNSNNFYPWWITLQESKIPGTHHEAMFAATLFQLLNKILLSKYHRIFDDAYNKLKDEYNQSIKIINANSNSLSKADIEKIQEELISEVESRLKKIGLDLFLDV